jgi:hypothetical protein
MNTNVLDGIGYIAKAVVDLLGPDKKDIATAWNDFMIGLGKLQLHTQIVKSMEGVPESPRG